MRKDIEIPEVENIFIAAVKEWDEAFLNQSWNIYLINNSSTLMETTIVVSRGGDGERKTATLRHGLGNITPKSYRKNEFLTEEVLSFTNEFLLTFFADGKLYDKVFSFAPNTINEKNLARIPLMDSDGVLAS